ncbi:3-oxoacyl-[acyl-carrier protein] reductase [Amycolatopsis marina]|uniref:3-oxoacyl-[acyl-carrier protein] reductase n=1 Tax=Amycolatopsis marina TaxID=490629 RepID=A0A1I1API0_9PSEU|nr:SDR family oxidoreductase [Amycolatopsis marina]SFB39949.1 3-oxoacyl-[acyl-carrier protein] reductase [Amycolatopsis marina]
MHTTRGAVTALVTGASAGIGRATAVAYGATGAQVGITYRKDRAAAEETARQVRSVGGQALPVALDLGDPSGIAAAVATVQGWAGDIDVLVNNAYDAGEWTPGTDTAFEDIPVGQWQHILRQNLEGAFHVVRAVLPGMRRREAGRMVLISSGAVEHGSTGTGPYAAAKAGLHGLCRSLAAELGPAGILVNVVMPGITTTERALRSLPPSLVDAVTDATPTRRLSTPDDVAQSILFLGSTANGNITGQVVRVTGGQ